MFVQSGLNKQQQLAVSITDGAVLVVAGAGTGKTKVITSRIANIVLSGRCSLNEILAVTFTNKAAREMTQRTIDLLAKNGYELANVHNLWIGTFHSNALKIIRPLFEEFDRRENFDVIKNSEQVKIIKQLMHCKGFNDTIFNPKDVLFTITNWKENCLEPKSAKNEIENIALKIADYYEEELKRLNVIDFSDILKHSIEIFKKNPEVLQYYQKKFKYIMVDEYQDTNASQYMWLRLLSLGHGNICCVGDDDQSIYAWRGADINNILNFNKDFRATKIIKLEQNYRSTGNILKAASGVIAHNKARIEKTFKTDQKDSLPIMLSRASDPEDEAQIIANIIVMKLKHGYKYSDFAVLVRTAIQTRAIEDELMSRKIPYVLSDGTRFYERTEVKDIVAYLKLLVNPNDEISFKRIVNVPRRGIGSATISKLYELAIERDIPIADAAIISGNKKLVDFFNKMSEWRNLMRTVPFHKLATTILDQSGYMEMINSMPENDEKLIIIDDLMMTLKQYSSVREFLDYVGLATDNPIDKRNSVSVSTIHAAKGLEYDVVFIPGMEEGILPHQKSLRERNGIEEERRLFYVALTRAKKEVFITMCDYRPMYGISTNRYTQKNVFDTRISRFVMELPHDCIRWF